jgi:alcohol dehydrogenase YqhD (iron-dependent ADH family)
VEASSRLLTSVNAMEEIMRIRQAVISAIVTLSAAGSIMASSAAIATTAQASTTAVAASAAPNTFFHG